jgi:hypothetical protein
MDRHMPLLLLIIFCIAFAAIPQFVLADGGIWWPDHSKYVYAPSQKAAVLWDGSKETLILSTKIVMDEPNNVAWVVPIQSISKPEVTKGDINIFFTISNLLQAPSRYRGFGLFMGMRAGLDDYQGVEVLEEKKVDIYDIAILRADNTSSLIDWLNDNGFSTPQEALPSLQYYVDRPNFFFVANKINFANKYGDLNITDNDKNCAEMMTRFSQEEYYVRRVLPQGNFVAETLTKGFSLPDYVIEACMNTTVSNEAVDALYSLKNGVATPLKIEFYPEKPFYPMKMTSINPGDITANVYVLSTVPMKDTNGIMTIEKMRSISYSSQEHLNASGLNFLTSLTYTGKTSQLVQDSVFEMTYFDCEKDPGCETAPQIMARFLGGLLFAFMFIIFLWWLFIPAIAGFLIGWKWGKGKPWKDRILLFLLLAIIESVIISMFFGLMGGFNVIIFFILMIFLPMTALAYFPATTKWKEWKVILAIIIIFVLSIAILMMWV